MKKPLIVVLCVIALCIFLAVPLLRQPASPHSQGAPLPTPQSASQPTPQSTPQSTTQDTPQSTLQPTPKSTLQNAPQSTSQSTPRPTPQGGQQPTSRTLQEAVKDATNYLAETQEPYALLMLNVLYRRFGITEFANSLRQYDELLFSNPDNASLLRVFRRIADYNNPLQAMDFYAVTIDIDRLTVPALYSDRLRLPDNYMSTLNDAANSGGYMLTHALLATIWLQDNHCEPPPDNFTESLYHANAALIGNGLVVKDLELEAAAFLYVAGQGTLVNDTFVQRIIATQNYDGGWSYSSDTPSDSYWHASVLGLMLLLHVEFPASSYPPMLASPTGLDAISLNPVTVFPIIACLMLVPLSKRKLYNLPKHCAFAI